MSVAMLTLRTKELMEVKYLGIGVGIDVVVVVIVSVGISALARSITVNKGLA